MIEEIKAYGKFEFHNIGHFLSLVKNTIVQKIMSIMRRTYTDLDQYLN